MKQLHSSFMDSILKHSRLPFSMRFGPVELFDTKFHSDYCIKSIDPCDFKSNFDKIDFTEDSYESSIKREDDDILKFSPGKNFPCPYKNCKKVYTSSYGLKYHMDHGHTAEKCNEKRPYVCNIENCGKTYKNNNGLKYHILHAHKGYEYNETDYFM